MYQSRPNQEIRYTRCFNKEFNTGNWLHRYQKAEKARGQFSTGKRVTAENKYHLYDWGAKETLVRVSSFQKLKEGPYRTSVHTCEGYQKADSVTTKRSWEQLLL